MSLLALGLAAGIALCMFLAERVWTGSPQFYTELMQLMNRALTVPAPALGMLGLIAIIVDAVLLFRRGASSASLSLVLVAVLFSVGAAALTKFGHFPINDVVLKWDPRNPPADWMTVQARWSALHVGRTICAVMGFALVLLSNLVR